MIPKVSQLFLGIAVLQIALCSASVAEGQLYIERPVVDDYRKVTAWMNRQSAVPEAVIDGDWLLTGWGPFIVDTPGVALVQLSTGKTLWTEPAEPEDWLTAAFIDGNVHVWRNVNDHDDMEYQVRNPATGAVHHAETITFGPNSTYLQHLTTVFIAGHGDVFDRRTGQRRGALPAEVASRHWVFRELAGRLYTMPYSSTQLDPQTKPTELLEIDLGNLAITRRWNFAEWFPDGRFREPLQGDERFLVFSDSPQWNSRALTAIDLEPRQVAWRIEVAPHAPLFFVHDLSAQPEMPADLAVRPLLIEWSTGEQRLGEPRDPRYAGLGYADLVQWLSPDGRGEMREIDDGFAMHLTSVNKTSWLVGLNRQGKPVWNREFGAKILMSDRVAVAVGAYELELVDLHTGESTHRVTPESVGLVRKPMRPENTVAAEPTTKSTPPATPPSSGWKLSDNVTIPAVALILLVGYLVVRRVALRPGGNPPGTL